MSEPVAADSSSFTPPKWVSWLIALVPIFPPIYLVALINLKFIAHLPTKFLYSLVVFFSLNLVSTSLTPKPFLSFLLELLRLFLCISLIVTGFIFGSSKLFKSLLYGISSVLIFSILYTANLFGLIGVFNHRLTSITYQPVALGLISLFTIILALNYEKNRILRLTCIILGCLTFILSASRGPLLALIGGIFGLIITKKLKVSVRLLFFVIFGCIIIAYSPLGKRLVGDSFSGRNYVWQDAAKAVEIFPYGGVGPYQGGKYLTELNRHGCQLSQGLIDSDIPCPSFANNLFFIWLTSHNWAIQSLLENGLIGSIGLIIVLIHLFSYTFRSNDSPAIAIFWGCIFISLVDIVTIIPSPFFAELFWISCGILLKGKQ